MNCFSEGQQSFDERMGQLEGTDCPCDVEFPVNVVQLRFMAHGSWFVFYVLWFGFGFGVESSGFRVLGLALKVQVSGSRFKG